MGWGESEERQARKLLVGEFSGLTVDSLNRRKCKREIKP